MAKEGTITQRDLDSLAGGGLVRSATAVANGGDWSVVFHLGNVDRTLTTINGGTIKTWSGLDGLRDYLAKYGIRTFAVNGESYDKKDKRKRKRPDAAAALQDAHDAKKYNDYVLKHVDEALAELKSGKAKLLTNEQVKEEMRAIRADLLAGKRKRATH